jgi:hypothetical protein
MNALLLAVAGLSLLLAAIASTIAWRVTRDAKRRSDARVAALSREIYGDDDAADGIVTSSPWAARYGLMAIGPAVIVVVAAFMWAGPFRPAGAATPKGSTHVAAHKPVEIPLELLALEHERDGGRLVVRGLVRNPAHGAARDGLIVVVLAYGRTGDLLASGRAAVLTAKLAPGETTPFVVNVAGADVIDRFRVSFRTGTRVESHVDRRPRVDTAKEVDP